MKPKSYVIIAILVLVLIILFQNLHKAFIHILFWTIEISMLLVIFLSFILGGILGWLLKSLWISHKNMKDQAKTKPVK